MIANVSRFQKNSDKIQIFDVDRKHNFIFSIYTFLIWRGGRAISLMESDRILLCLMKFSLKNETLKLRLLSPKQRFHCYVDLSLSLFRFSFTFCAMNCVRTQHSVSKFGCRYDNSEFRMIVQKCVRNICRFPYFCLFVCSCH